MASDLFVASAPRGGIEKVCCPQQGVLPESLVEGKDGLLASAFLDFRFGRREKRELLLAFRFYMIRAEQDAADGMAGQHDALVERGETVRDDGTGVRGRIEPDSTGGGRQEEVRPRTVDDAHGDGCGDDMARRKIQSELVGHLDEYDARLGIAVVAQEHLTLGDRLRLGTVRMDLGNRRRLAPPCVIVQEIAVDAERFADGLVWRVRDVAHRA